MTNLGARVVTLAACMIARGVCVYGQAVEDPVVLKIDVENHVAYRGTVFDVTKVGKDPGPTTQAEQAPFVPFLNTTSHRGPRTEIF